MSTEAVEKKDQLDLSKYGACPNGKKENSEDTSDIAERVKKLIGDQLGIEDASTILEDASFMNDLKTDSLDMVELVMALEEAFDIEISEEAAEKIATVKDAIAYVASSVSTRQAEGK